GQARAADGPGLADACGEEVAGVGPVRVCVGAAIVHVARAGVAHSVAVLGRIATVPTTRGGAARGGALGVRGARCRPTARLGQVAWARGCAADGVRRCGPTADADTGSVASVVDCARVVVVARGSGRYAAALRIAAVIRNARGVTVDVHGDGRRS